MALFFRLLHAPLVSFTDPKKAIAWWRISWSCDEWISFCPRGFRKLFIVCLQFSWVSNFCSEMQFRIYYRKEFERRKIHHVDKTCLILDTFVLRKLQPVSKRRLSSRDRNVQRPAKKPFQQTKSNDAKDRKRKCCRFRICKRSDKPKIELDARLRNLKRELKLLLGCDV